MLFNTLQFAIFLAVVWPVYLLLRRRSQNFFLLVASWCFYAAWDWRFLGLLATSTIVDYYCALGMRDSAGARKRLLLLISVCTNLSILGFFKYCDFFITSFARLINAFGLHPHISVLGVILPVGISFYTFQSMAYTIDVYRGKFEPRRDFITFALYVSYFPQLVAGPIERAAHMFPQFENDRVVTLQNIKSGGYLILLGLVRKMAIADYIAPTVNDIFANPGAYGATALLLGAFLFALQLYGDFAGYSDIARGVSRLFGVELMVNFQQPYFATSITDFWRRWHISLSTWLRDYLYIPLGGSRGSRLFHYRNLMITMVLGGMWHGAAWTFIAWGLLHGMALVVHKMWLNTVGAPEDRGRTGIHWCLLGWTLTMGVWGLSCIFFRSEGNSAALEYLAGLLSLRDGMSIAWHIPVFALVLTFLIDLPQRISGKHEIALRWPWYIQEITVVAMVILLLYTGRPNEIPFIYFQF